MKQSRRDFLRYSGLASASLFIPQFLKASNPFLTNGERKKILVVIQMSGGNDGLNCIIPYRNDLYYQYRPTIGYKKDELIHLSDDTGMNTNLQGLADLFFNGEVVIINNVGYPNPNRSHFRSMDIWQSASDENVYLQTGWLGRVLDSSCNNKDCVKPHTAIEIDDSLSLAMKGEIMSGFATRNPDQLKIGQNPFITSVSGGYAKHDDDHNVEYLHKLLAETTESAGYIYEHSKKYTSQKFYPQTELGRQLKIIAELIVGECDTSIYYVSISGFDTHAFQRGQQERQLKQYADAVKIFCDDLKTNGKFKDTLIMTFSEFGRRVEENASKGTDHGTASNIYLIGGGMKQGGMMNDLASLSDLDDGDLKYEIDFRNVYATVLDKWLQTDSSAVLGRKFQNLDFL